jgi:Tfp pilus assembly protein PilP
MIKRMPLKMQRIFVILAMLAVFAANIFAQVNSSAQKEEVIRVAAVEYKSDSLRDPFMVPGEEEEKEEKVQAAQEQAAAKPLPSLTVQGIIWGSNIPQAIINNTVVRVGDSIAEVKIVRIDKEGVEVFYSGRTYLLSSPSALASESKGR